MRKYIVQTAASGLMLYAAFAVAAPLDFSNYLKNNLQVAVLAGGCFWCMQPPFDSIDGVVDTIVGYTGGTTLDPTYQSTSSGNTGHVEAVAVIYNPAIISYAQILDIFWRNIDPTQVGGQFVDRGSQYATAIFPTTQQRSIAAASKQQLARSGKFDDAIVTKILGIRPFYTAEKYHQDYYLKNPLRYKFYSYHSGRKQFIHDTWGSSD